MKYIYLILTILFSNGITAQQIVDIQSGTAFDDVPAGTYFKDVNGAFNKFIGTYAWEENGDKLTITIQKLEHVPYYSSGKFYDCIVGNYKFTKNNGQTIVVDSANQTSVLPHDRVMYTYGVGNNDVEFFFKDLIITHKPKGSRAEMKFTDNNHTHINLILRDIGGLAGVNGELANDMGFSIPRTVTLVRQ